MHQDYLKAGANVLETNTYQICESNLGGLQGVTVEELAQSAAVERVESARSQATEAQPARPALVATAPASTTELIESQQGRVADAPLCLTCGSKMRPAGSCYVCEGCGSTSGCS